MFNSFSSALSALKAHSTAVDTVGNNLANVNTTGFKASDVQFKDVVAQVVGGSRSDIGMGVSRPISVRNYSQGAIQSSAGVLDVALQGRGFFVVKNSAGESLFTRDGSFQVDAEGYVVTLTGEKVQAYAPGKGLEDIKIPTIAQGAQTTANITVTANLDAGATVGETSRMAAPVKVVDSLGITHVLTVTYEKTGPNEWKYDVTIPGADVSEDDPQVVGSGTMTFDASGQMTAPSAEDDATVLEIAGLASGAADLNINFNLFDKDLKPMLSQYGQKSGVSGTVQDGVEAAEMVGVAMNDGGIIMCKYANGQNKPQGQLAIALVANPDTLQGASNNTFRASFDTADPSFGFADTAGRGKVKANSLEGSTVDIAREFTNLIIYQRGYQANSRVITTADELSQEVLNLKR